MSLRERQVEAYLVARVKALGGEVRKVRWIGRNGAPDRRVMLWTGPFWVEVKAPGVPLKPHQEREHRRMRENGETVYVVDSIEAIEDLL